MFQLLYQSRYKSYMMWYFVNSFVMFWRMAVPASWWSSILLDTLLGLHNSQDEGILILQNIRNYLPKNAKYHPRRLLSSAQHCYKYLKSKFCVYKQRWTSQKLGRMNIAMKMDNHKCTLPAECLSLFSLCQCLSFCNLKIEIKETKTATSLVNVNYIYLCSLHINGSMS